MLALTHRDHFRHVLVVDDHQAQRYTLTALLEREGFTVHTEATGAGTIAAVAAQPFAAVLVDPFVPDMPGQRLLEQLHRHAPSLPIIVHTTWGHRGRSSPHGAWVSCLEKPAEPQELVRTVYRAAHARAVAQAEQHYHNHRAAQEQVELTQPLQELGLLVTEVNHDFNNVLALLTGGVQQLLEALERTNPLRHTVVELQQTIQRGVELSRLLLAFSRRAPAPPVPLDLNARVTEFGRLIRNLLGRRIQVQLDLVPRLPLILADPVQIDRILLNLVANAKDAMPNGGTLILSTQAVDDHVARLVVRDTGHGMEKATLQRIFERHFTTKPAGQGSGLGLATVADLVRSLGGQIHVESKVDDGTRFHIDLPLLRSVPTTPPPIQVGGHETLLLVEDEDLLRSLIRQTLQPLGYTILEADCAQSALDLLRGYRGGIHLLITDVKLPDRDGRDVAELAMEMRTGLQVLFISGLAAADLVGAYLPKPFAPRELVQQVRVLLDRPTLTLAD
jgi:hypothetical protein